MVRTSGLHRKKLFVVTAVSLFLIVMMLGIFYHNNVFDKGSVGNSTVSGNGRVIIGQGTSITIADGAFRYIPFDLNVSSTLSGGFTASRGITMYVIPSSSASSLDSHGVPLSYRYTTGHVSEASFSTILTKGSYDIMLANDNGLNSVSVVTFTTGVTLSS